MICHSSVLPNLCQHIHISACALGSLHFRDWIDTKFSNFNNTVYRTSKKPKMGLEGAKLELEVEVKALREYYKSGKTKEESWRRAHLLGLGKLHEEKEGEI
ncbi:hypothetical protein QQ045_023224 [Rhodiola kirilowii]